MPSEPNTALQSPIDKSSSAATVTATDHQIEPMQRQADAKPSLKPSLCLAVGVTGHRLRRLQDQNLQA